MRRSARCVLILALCLVLSLSGVLAGVRAARGAETGTGTVVNAGLTTTNVRSLAINPLTATTLYAGTEASAGSLNSDVVHTFTDDSGRQLDETVISGRPPAVKAKVATIPRSSADGETNVLSNVPAFDWSYGCSPTAAAMLFGYYDNNGYPNMYTGPTNGGVCPMTNAAWGVGESPLSASHLGIDSRTTRGHVDDYWTDNAGPDPYIGNWLEHSSDSTADFMGSNQSKYGNDDGVTTFYRYRSGQPEYDYNPNNPNIRDGCHGLRLFAESRGYTVVSNFSQYILGQAPNDPTTGFTFEQFKSEIDAGRPVLIDVTGHTMLGYGYRPADQKIYVHDTWDYAPHEMTWGGTYPYGDTSLQQYAVTVIHLAAIGYFLTVSASPIAGGTVAKSPNQSSYPSGTVVALTANANPGYTFTGWSGNLTGTTNPTTITMSANRSVTALFQAGTLPDLTVDTLSFDPTQPVPGGSVRLYFTIHNQGSASVAADYNLDIYVDGAFRVTAADTMRLASGASAIWHWDATWPSDTASHTFMVVLDSSGVIAESNESNNSASISASAAPVMYTLTTTASPSAGGSIGRSPNAASYASGTVVTLTALPASGYTFTGWSGDASGTSLSTSITMDADKTVTAVFQAGTSIYTLTSPNGAESWVPGSLQNITWTVNGDTSAIHHFSLYYTVDGGNSWESIGFAPSAARSSSWTVPVRFSSHAKVIVYAMNAASALQAYDASDSFFTIAPAGTGTLPVVTLVHPSADTWTAGTTQMITWSVNGSLPASFHHFSVYYCLEDGRNGSWFLVGYSTIPSLSWAIPGAIGSARAKIVVYPMDVHSLLLADAVLASFIITPATGAYDLAVTAPASAATLHVNDTAPVTWIETGTVPSSVSYKVYYSVDGALSWEYAGITGASPFSWTVPARFSSTCSVMVVATDAIGNVLGVATSSTFTIAP